MTEKEILEGSKLICEFIGGDVRESWRVQDKVNHAWYGEEAEEWRVNIAKLPKGICLLLEYCEFHIDWNWLIPVYNKLRQELLYNRQIRDVFIRAASPVEKCALKDWPHLGLEGVFDINGSFLKVVDLVRWYNENCK